MGKKAKKIRNYRFHLKSKQKTTVTLAKCCLAGGSIRAIKAFSIQKSKVKFFY